MASQCAATELTGQSFYGEESDGTNSKRKQAGACECALCKIVRIYLYIVCEVIFVYGLAQIFHHGGLDLFCQGVKLVVRGPWNSEHASQFGLDVFKHLLHRTKSQLQEKMEKMCEYTTQYSTRRRRKNI